MTLPKSKCGPCTRSIGITCQKLSKMQILRLRPAEPETQPSSQGLQDRALGVTWCLCIWRIPALTTSLPIVVLQLLSCVWLLRTPWTAACQASLTSTISWSPLRLMSIESVMLSHHLTLFCPLLLPSIFPSIRVFLSESALCIRWPKLELQLQHQSFQWIFRVDLL